jgi:hypothetical protein
MANLLMTSFCSVFAGALVALLIFVRVNYHVQGRTAGRPRINPTDNATVGESPNRLP